ncbi:MAG: hypothetical protein IPL40_06435 [Proteobacteria bacterium]|nr:hypothetical protein [Pseudomonadota bacterium]
MARTSQAASAARVIVTAMMRRRAVVVLLLACSLLVTPPQAGAAPQAPADGGVASAPTPERKDGGVWAAQQRESEARALLRVVSDLRELRIRAAVPMIVASRAQVVAQIEQRLATEYEQAEIANEEQVLKRLGLLPLELDYRQAVLALLSEQIAGFYDPQARRLAIADWLPLLLQRPTLVHELCHALQDQHFHLLRFVRPLKDNGDRQLAQAALVEGDCTAVMLEDVLQPAGLDLSSVPGQLEQFVGAALAGGGGGGKSVPPFLREVLTFPYLSGLRLIQRVRATEPWSAVSALFRRPPETTEQVLHFEKYRSHEPALRLRPRALPALASASIVRQDTLGEFQLRLYLAQGVDSAVAERAAAGWGGDRLVAYRLSEGAPLPAIVHLTAWDSEADAVEFSNAEQHLFADRLARERQPPTPEALAGVIVYRDGAGAEWSVERRGSLVLSLLAFPAEQRARLQQEVWLHWCGAALRCVRARAAPSKRP